jgi:radical SAM protein with 4Fe4S-binding SPASM domain
MAEYKIKGDTKRIPLQDHIPLDTPLHVFIEGASACNFRCFFCFHNVPVQNQNINGIMPLGLAKKCIDDLKMFPQKIKLLSFSINGESLLNKNLPEMISYAKQSGVVEKVDFTTNASLLTHDITDKLIMAGVDRIHISVYGLSDSQYAKTTSSKLNFATFIENIGYLYQNKKQCVIVIKFCDAAFEKPQDEQVFYDIFSEMCDSLSIEHIVPICYDVPYDTNISSKKIDIYGKEVVRKKICPLPFYDMAIHPDGTVSPCCPDWNNKLVVGNANAESLYSIWNGMAYENIWEKQLIHGKSSVSACINCEYPDFASLDNIDPYRETILHRFEEQKK